MNNKLTLSRTAWIALLASLTAVAPVLAQANTVVQAQTAVKSQSADQIYTGIVSRTRSLPTTARSSSLVTNHRRKLFKGKVLMSLI